jgi:ferredoxin
MKAVVDLAKCQGYANCVMEADAVFDVDEETSKAVVLVDAVPDHLVEDARRAAASCPVDAISLQP